MSYTLSVGLALGSSQTGLTLKAQLMDTAGADVGSEVTTGFVEIGGGAYLWTYASFPDAFRGGVRFYTGAAPGTFKAFAAINPEEAEYTDAKTSGVETDTANIQTRLPAALVSGRIDASVGAMANDVITAAAHDESTAYPLKSADTGATQVARVGADADTLETLSDQLDGQEPVDIWGYATRTLTQSAASVAAAIEGSVITIRRGDTLSVSLTGLGSLVARSKLWFTIKKRYSDIDAAALAMINTVTGLVYINGAVAGTAANGSITVNDENAGDITIALDEVETAKLSLQDGLVYDVQMLTTSGSVSTMTEGTCIVIGDVTLAVT